MPSVQAMPTRLPADADDVRQQPRGGRFAVDAGDGDDRNAAVLPSGNIMSMIASPTGRGCAFRRRQVHPQSGAGVHFDDHAALLRERAEMSRATTSTPAMSSPTAMRRVDRAARNFGMHLVGDIGRRAAGAQVRVAANEHLGAGGRNRIGRVTLLRTQDGGAIASIDEAEHGGVAVAAPRVAVASLATSCEIVERPSPMTWAGSRGERRPAGCR